EELVAISFYVRTSLDPNQLLRAIPPAVSRIDANLPVQEPRTLPQQVRATVAGIATILAAVGLYGVLAYTVAQRTREIGLRMALGAAPARVRRMVLRQVAIMTGIGGTLGLVAAIWAGRAAKAILYQMEGHDPIV